MPANVEGTIRTGRRRGLVLAVLGMATGLGMILWMFIGDRRDSPATTKSSRPAGVHRSHPAWGAVTEIQAADGASIFGMDSGPGFLNWVNRQVVRLGWVKSGQPLPWARPSPGILSLGGHSLEWSMRNSDDGSGWLYFWDPNGTRSMVWSFAPVEVTALESLEPSHLEGPFYSQVSTGWPSIFGVRQRGQSAIQVSKGQVLLGRHQLDSNAVYALELTESSNAMVRVTYLRVPVAPAGDVAP